MMRWCSPVVDYYIMIGVVAVKSERVDATLTLTELLISCSADHCSCQLVVVSRLTSNEQALHATPY